MKWRAERAVGGADLDVLADKVGDGLEEAAAGVDGADHVLAAPDDAGRQTDAVVVLAEVGRLVDDARARIGRDVAVAQHPERPFALHLNRNPNRDGDIQTKRQQRGRLPRRSKGRAAGRSCP